MRDKWWMQTAKQANMDDEARKEHEEELLGLNCTCGAAFFNLTAKMRRARRDCMAQSPPATELFVLPADFADRADYRVLGFFDDESLHLRRSFLFIDSICFYAMNRVATVIWFEKSRRNGWY